MPAPVSSTTTRRSCVWLLVFCAASGERRSSAMSDATPPARIREDDPLSFRERVRLEVRIDPVSLDRPLFVRLAAGAAGDEMGKLMPLTALYSDRCISSVAGGPCAPRPRRPCAGSAAPPRLRRWLHPRRAVLPAESRPGRQRPDRADPDRRVRRIRGRQDRSTSTSTACASSCR